MRLEWFSVSRRPAVAFLAMLAVCLVTWSAAQQHPSHPAPSAPVASSPTPLSPSHAAAPSPAVRRDSIPLAVRRKAQVAADFARQPLQFEQNAGQASGDIRFLSLNGVYQVALTPDEVLLKSKQTPRKTTAANDLVRMRLLGANPNPAITGEDRLPGKVNYFIGNDPTRWHTNIPTYARVRLQQVYPGVDLVYYGNQQQLEYDFLVQPGADPARVRLGFSGAKHLKVAANGDLLLRAGTGEVRWKRPVVYQTINGKRHPVQARYTVHPLRNGAARVGFALARYDRSQPLVIDPVLVIRFDLTQTGTDAQTGSISTNANGIAVDAAGNSYVVGDTNSTTLISGAGGFDILVTKSDVNGGTLYTAHIGGSGDEHGEAIAIDGSGNAYITGTTRSTNMPVPNAINSASPAYNGSTLKGTQDPYVAKLNAAGNTLLYGTYYGGNSTETANGIAVDSNGTAYITGSTPTATNFPITASALQSTYGGSFGDGYMAALTFSGSGTVGIAYSTFLGGSGFDSGDAIAVEPGSGIVYVVGATHSFTTGSNQFPTTASGLQTTYQGLEDGFLVRINTNLSGAASLLYGTHLAGSNDPVNGAGQATNTSVGVVYAGSGIVYITGETFANNFPIKNAFQATYGGNADGYLAEIDTTKSGSASLIYGSYIGGSAFDQGSAVAIDGSGNVYITGATESSNFPTSNPAQATNAGGGNNEDAIVAKFNTSNTGVNTLIWSTYLGTSRDDAGNGIGVDANGNTFVAGSRPAFGTTNGEAFLAKLNINVAPVANNQSVTVVQDTGKAITLTASDTDGDSLTYTVTANPSHGTLTGTAPNLNYTPAIGYFGPDSFQFRTNDGFENSNIATVTINVVGKPTANSQSVTTNENTAVGITLTGSDPNSPALSLTYTVTANPAHGALSGTAPNLTYTPNSNFFGSDSFQFKVNNGHLDSNIATVSITVIGKPTANGQSVTTNVNTAVGITLTGSDPNTPALSLTYTVTANPSHGSLSGTAPNLTYTPNNGYTGPDSFQFKVNNGHLDSNIATVSITVSAGTPTANSQSVSTNQDTPVGITLTGSDPNSLPLTYIVTSSPSHGSLSGTAPNLTYTPNAGFFGADSFQFKVNNGASDSNIATVSITVNQTLIDVSGQVSVSPGVFVYERATGTYRQMVTLTNTGGTTINGPISLILSGLTNATLANATGTTSAVTPAGRPYINASVSTLAAGASTTVTLRFTKTGAGAITYSTQVVAGPGSR